MQASAKDTEDLTDAQPDSKPFIPAVLMAQEMADVVQMSSAPEIAGYGAIDTEGGGIINTGVLEDDNISTDSDQFAGRRV